MSHCLKDLYNKEYIYTLASTIHSVDANFLVQPFIDTIFTKDFQDKELKARMRYISTSLKIFLPERYEKSINILKDTFSKMNHLYSLENIIFQDYVEVYGLNFFDISMVALEHFTIGSTSEFAVRAFILQDEDKTLAVMRKWAKSNNEELRRLASEGCRPRLPWAVALNSFKTNPSKILTILEILKDDDSKYVQKSVANSLNDISKDNPDILKDIVEKWIGKKDSRDWILKHGCRTLLKAGDAEVLKLFGYDNIDDIKISSFTLSKDVKLGDTLSFEFQLKSIKDIKKLRIEYIIEFVRLNNKFSKKVFKISEGSFKKGERLINKKHSFKPISTRKYYSGKHKIFLVLNGKIVKEEEFSLC